MAQLNGTPGMDILVGTADPDQIVGLDGADVLVGDAGDDAILGGLGYDLIGGGAGNDVIDGGEGIDIVALTGELSDYLVEEVTAPTAATPGVYRITDQRAGAPEGSDTITGIEKLRFEIGGEVSLADALNRAPTDLVLGHIPAGGPRVVETATRGKVVAVLSGIDPDPGDQFTFELVDDAGGRFAIDGNKLIVAVDDAFDFEEDESHTVAIRVTDHAGNSFAEDRRHRGGRSQRHLHERVGGVAQRSAQRRPVGARRGRLRHHLARELRRPGHLVRPPGRGRRRDLRSDGAGQGFAHASRRFGPANSLASMTRASPPSWWRAPRRSPT